MSLSTGIGVTTLLQAKPLPCWLENVSISVAVHKRVSWKWTLVLCAEKKIWERRLNLCVSGPKGRINCKILPPHSDADAQHGAVPLPWRGFRSGPQAARPGDVFLELGGVGRTNKTLGTGGVRSVSHHSQ